MKGTKDFAQYQHMNNLCTDTLLRFIFFLNPESKQNQPHYKIRVEILICFSAQFHQNTV